MQCEVNELHDTVHGLSDELAQQRHTVVELESARDHLHVGGRYFQGCHNACQQTMHPMSTPVHSRRDEGRLCTPSHTMTRYTPFCCL